MLEWSKVSRNRVSRSGLAVTFVAALVIGAFQARPQTLLGQATSQDQMSPQLTLNEAIELARLNNPGFLSRQNNTDATGWGVRSAYGAFLPTASASSTVQWEAPGVQNFGVVNLGSAATGFLFSNYGLRLGFDLDGQRIFGISTARAEHAAEQADVDLARFDLESQVTGQYLAVLRARDGVVVAKAQLERAQEDWEGAAARVEVGQRVATEAKQAEVQHGRARVKLLQDEQLLRTENLRLAQELGVELDPGTVLVSEFQVFTPEWDKEVLLGAALDAHPQVRSYAAAERAARARLRQQQSRYLPSLGASARWGGFANEATDPDFLIARARASRAGQMASCESTNDLYSRLANPLPAEDCSGLVLTEEDERAIVEENNVFPFNFTKSPFRFSVTLSVPIFQGFSRQNQVAQAQVTLEDARHNRRSEELRVKTEVNRTYDDLITAQQIVVIEERNVEVAREQRELESQRYLFGVTDFLELLRAEETLQTAEQAHLNAIYNFHAALVALEGATGVRLRQAEGN